jgi:oleandomycin transport system permease protein
MSSVESLRHGVFLAWRGIRKIRSDPTQLLDVVLQPVTTLIVFVYAFGGSLADDTGLYLRSLVPGLTVQTVLVASLAAGVTLNADVHSGVVDRFRSMPIGRSAPLIGTVLAAAVRYLLALVVLLSAATIMGYRVHTNIVSVSIGVVVMVLTGLSLCWVSVFLGLVLRNPASLQGVFIAFVLPLTFGSNVFVSIATMPGWLQAWSRISPVSLLADGMRGLMNGPPRWAPLLEGLGWLVGIVAVFFPLAVLAYR